MFVPGSARVPRVGDGVPAIADFWLRVELHGKDCCGETPQPARETRALPGICDRNAWQIPAFEDR